MILLEAAALQQSAMHDLDRLLAQFLHTDTKELIDQITTLGKKQIRNLAGEELLL